MSKLAGSAQPDDIHREERKTARETVWDVALADSCQATDATRTDCLERKQGNIRYLSIDVVDKEMRGNAIKARDTKEPDDASH